MIGISLNKYRIIASIGAGGMGEVFRARDTRLNRDVAVKVLPKDFAGDTDRLRRFEQEAKTLAALNHPNVLTVFDAGLHEGAPYLVSELLEGKTLREQLGTSNAALPVRKATDYALQIAQGLAAAHSKGIIHRDLKPENIFLTKDDRVKILDFGLAKLQSNLKSEISNLKFPDEAAPTVLQTTEPGRVLGTPAYMSPEQVRGEPADQRTDIFAFGCVLYEMLRGTRAFRRDTAVQSMNAVLSEDPAEFTADNPKIPPALERIVYRCLEKRPERRFQTADDLAFAIENGSTGSTTFSGEAVARTGVPWHWKQFVPWTLAGLSVAALGWLVLGKSASGPSRGPQPLHPLRKLELTLTTPGTPLAPTAHVRPVISPDGRKIAYAAPDGLWLRWLDQLAPPVALVKGEDILAPFWSPQSTEVAYFEGKSLMRVSISEKHPTSVTTLPESLDGDSAGGAWLTGDQIIFTTGQPALYQVAAQGGKVVTALAGGEGEKSFVRATALPGGQGAVFLVNRSNDQNRAIVLWGPQGKRTVVLEAGKIHVGGLACSATGQVLFDRWDATRGIWAVPFSLGRLQSTGELRRISDTGYLPSVAEDGTLACGMGGQQDYATAARRLAWVDRSGNVLSATSKALPSLAGVRLSPDGRRAVAMAGETVDGLDIWLFDLINGQAFPLTQTPVQDSLPGWWDQERVFFSRPGTNGIEQVVVKAAQAIGQEDILASDLTCWTVFPARKLLLGQAHRKWGYLSLAGSGQPFAPLPQPLQRMGQPEFSPDGRQLAYRSPGSGPGEVYVVDFPGFTSVRQASRGGGFDPHWRPGSTELFFLSEDGRALMSARQKTGTADFEEPIKAFDLPQSIDPGRPDWPAFYSISPDGDRFLMLQKSGDLSPDAQATKSNAMLIENWSEEK